MSKKLAVLHFFFKRAAGFLVTFDIRSLARQIAYEPSYLHIFRKSASVETRYLLTNKDLTKGMSSFFMINETQLIIC